MQLIINYHYWLVRPAPFPAASAGVVRGWHEARPGVLLALRGDVREAGRRRSASQHSFARPLTSAVLSESSSHLSSIPGIAGPVLLVPLLPAGRKEEKKGWLPESASGRQKDRVLCARARVCICVRSFRCPYVGLVMRERMRSLRRETGGRVLDETLYRLSPRTTPLFYRARGRPVSASAAPGNVNYAGVCN